MMTIPITELKATISSADAVPKVIEFLKGWDFSRCGATVHIYVKKDLQPYKAVFWIWMRQLAEAFTKRDKAHWAVDDGRRKNITKDTPGAFWVDKHYTDAEMHDLICHKFLGYTPERTLGKTVIKSALITITYPEQLKGNEFGELLMKIETWAVDVGVRLKTQAKSEYMGYKEANE